MSDVSITSQRQYRLYWKGFWGSINDDTSTMIQQQQYINNDTSTTIHQQRYINNDSGKLLRLTQILWFVCQARLSSPSIHKYSKYLRVERLLCRSKTDPIEASLCIHHHGERGTSPVFNTVTKGKFPIFNTSCPCHLLCHQEYLIKKGIQILFMKFRDERSVCVV